MWPTPTPVPTPSIGSPLDLAIAPEFSQTLASDIVQGWNTYIAGEWWAIISFLVLLALVGGIVVALMHMMSEESE